MGAQDISAIIQAVAAVFGAISAFIVAFVAFRYERETTRARKVEHVKKTVSDQFGSLQTWYDQQIQPNSEKPLIPETLERAASALKSYDADTAAFQVLSGLLAGHSTWIDNRGMFQTWIAKLDEPDETAWIDNIRSSVNGVLDVTKDYVLKEGDYDYPTESFWEWDDDAVLHGPVPDFFSDSSVLAGFEQKWIGSTMPQEVSLRLKALVWYKLLLEHHISIYSPENTFNGRKMTSIAPSEFFVPVVNGVWTDIRDSLYDEADRLSQQIK